jgi:hypothetical protein
MEEALNREGDFRSPLFYWILEGENLGKAI